MDGPMDGPMDVGHTPHRRNRTSRRDHRSRLAAAAAISAATTFLLRIASLPKFRASGPFRGPSGCDDRPVGGVEGRRALYGAPLGERRPPAMHTFFQPIDPSERGTAMSDDADRELLRAWREAWSAAGWEPVVLTLDDAKRHPEFERYSEKLQDVPMMGRGGKGLNIFYNRLCYYRWLAMAASGGGWMSDYDVFPLNPSLPADVGPEEGGGLRPGDPDIMPNGGDFTVYSVIPNSDGKGVPCLMSGRAGEWTRMALNILRDGLNHPNERMWTDFFALMDIRGVYATRDDVVEPGKGLLSDDGPWGRERCDSLRGRRAAHFSHNALGQERVGRRPEVIRTFLEKWRGCHAGLPSPEQGKPNPEQGQPRPEQVKPRPEQGQPQAEQVQPHLDQAQPHPEKGHLRPKQGQPRTDQAPEQGQPRPEQKGGVAKVDK